MKSLFLSLIFLNFFSLHSNQNVGRRLGQAGFVSGSFATVFYIANKYQLAFGLGSLGTGLFLLSPVAEEVFGDSIQLNSRNIDRYGLLLSCGIGGFSFVAIGLKAISGYIAKSIMESA